jgi:anti-sigma factor RsiW
VTRPGLTCRELVELVTEELEGALSAVESARFHEHLAACEGCDAYLAQYLAAIAAVGALADHPGDPGRWA